MRKMILFIVVFFVVDRFMNYKLNHSSVKSRIVVAANNAMSKHILLSEKKERALDVNKKMLLAQSKKSTYLSKILSFNKLFHSSNRNV